MRPFRLPFGNSAVTHDQPDHFAFERAQLKLERALGSRFLTSQERCELYQTDDTGIQGCAQGVVLAESTSDIQKALEICDQFALPVTARAGGTGRTGGAVPTAGGIVLATHQMNQLIEFDRHEGTVTVGPGMNLEELWHTVEEEGWFYPPDPNSSKNCCLAGNLAENAAGPRAFKYGATRDYVLGVETYLPGGQHFYSGRRTKKGVTGYDTTALLVGSEGTLAAFGNITLRLLPRPESIMTLLVLFRSVTAAATAVDAIIHAKQNPRCIEFLDELTLQIMREAGNAIDQRAEALLLVEVDGSELDCLAQAERIGDLCEKHHALSVAVAQSENQRAKLWESRKQMSHAVRKFARHKISEDVVVPRRHLTRLIDQVRRSRDEFEIQALCYGHAGDGNLHVNFLFNDEDEKRRVDRAVEALFRRTVSLQGTLSGEHGIGLLKAPYLDLEQSTEQIELQQRLKRAFDPKGIMNPGKIFPGRGHGNC